MKVWTTQLAVRSETVGWGENKRTLPALDARIEVSIDLDKIISIYGSKAARSKGKSARMLAGLVKVKAVKVVELKP